MFNWAKGTPKSSTPIQSNLQKLWGWVSTQPRKYLLGIYTSCSSLAGLGHEAAPCYQESWPSCVRLQLCFSPTFRGNLHLFGALLNIRPLVFSLLFLPRPSAEPLFLSRPPIGVRVLLAPRRLSPRCRRALWQMWFTRSPLLVWGQSFLKVALISQSAPAGGRAALLSLPQHLHINDEAAVHATLTLGLHPQPGIVFKKAQWKGYLFQQNVTWCQQPSLFCRHSITVKCRLEMFFFISWVGFVKNPSAYVKKQVLLLDSETQIRCWLCVCVCVVAGLQSSSMTTEKTLASGMKSTMEGDARRTNQVGALWSSQQPGMIWPRGFSALWRARQLSFSCSNHTGHIYKTTLKRTNPSVSEQSHDISKLKLILICNNWTKFSNGPVLDDHKNVVIIISGVVFK